jgi:hypothetical protein
MATPEEIRKKLEAQATQRVNPLLKGLTMLTGGLAGEFTGTNEQIRQRNLAKRAIMEEDLATLQEQRLMERVRTQQAEMLKRQIELEKARTDEEQRRRLLEATGAEDVLTGRDQTFVGPIEPAQELGRQTARVQRLATREKEASEKAQLVGRLMAEMGPTERAAIDAGVVPRYEDMDIGTLRRMASASEVSQRQKQESRQAKLDEGKVFVSRSASGEVSVQGPADLVRKYQDANPDLFIKQKGSPYKISMRESEDGKSFNVDFGEMTTDQIENIAPQLDKMKRAFGVSPEADLSGAGSGASKVIPKAPAATPDEPLVNRGSGKPRSGAATAVAKDMVSQPEAEPQVLGPMSPEQEFAAVNRKLAEMEARGGASSYGARETLTTPFYTEVARQLNIQPEQVGGSVYFRTPRTSVAQNFPAETFKNLPQEVKNRLYIEAMNKSAEAMQQAKYKPSGTFADYQLNDKWIGSMFDKLSR